ncbi:MAG: caspase family protein [Thermoguttaceae bacterium]|nr:caspase family protein [Thermoguttaceae bacterium]
MTATGTLPAPKDFDKVSCGLPLSDKQLEGISDKPVIVTVKPVGTSSSRSAQTGDNIFPLAHLLVAGRETLAPEFRLAPLLSRLSGTKPVVEYRLRDSVLAIMELQAKENASQKESAAKKEAAKKVSAAPEKVILAGTRYLISLGISNYKNKISSITNAANDSEVVRSCFVDHCYVNLGNSICLSDSSVDNYNLNNLFCNYVPKLIRPGDPVFIYLSGHSGKVKPTKNQTVVPGDVYFVPQDGNPDDPEKTFLKMSTFASWLKKNYSKNPVVLILDFCWWAGSDKEANRTLFAPFAGLDNVAVIVPDVAWESSGTDSQSLLVQALCESIQNDHPRTHKDLFESMKKKYKEKVSKEHKEPGNLLFFNSMKKDLIIVP